MRDFTLEIYKELIRGLKENGYVFQTFSDFLISPEHRSVIIRHDIDLKKGSALKFSNLENELGVRATYFFRIVKYIFDQQIIKQVADCGHEIGYHYEDLSLAGGNVRKAIGLFERHLDQFREIYPVKTICMHGRSLSRFDNKDLWKTYNYHDYGIIGEPYFDLDFNKVLYLTDTAQRWNGSNISVRDKVKSRYNYSFKTTSDIVENIQELPNQMMITVHPDRWTDSTIEWYRINSIVKVKNYVKKNILKKRALPSNI